MDGLAAVVVDCAAGELDDALQVLPERAHRRSDVERLALKKISKISSGETTLRAIFFCIDPHLEQLRPVRQREKLGEIKVEIRLELVISKLVTLLG